MKQLSFIKIIIVASGIIFCAVMMIVLNTIHNYDNKSYIHSYYDDGVVTMPYEYGKICQNQGGIWLEKFHECEYGDKGWCEDVGGHFNECASACRHQPDALLCTKQCVLVCSFDK